MLSFHSTTNKSRFSTQPAKFNGRPAHRIITVSRARQTFPLEDAVAAREHSEKGEHFGKITLDIG